MQLEICCIVCHMIYLEIQRQQLPLWISYRSRLVPAPFDDAQEDSYEDISSEIVHQVTNVGVVNLTHGKLKQEVALSSWRWGIRQENND